MDYILLDTCVWLDLAKDPQKQPLVAVIVELIERKIIKLIVPRTVVTEFDRNKARVIEESGKSLSGVINRVKEIVRKLGNDERTHSVVDHLNEVSHKVPLMGGYAAQGTVNWIDAVFGTSEITEVSDDIKLHAVQRAIDHIAPFHRPKNNINDAIILETYIDHLNRARSKQSRYYFVTLNTEDFSIPAGNRKGPHPDLSTVFIDRSYYFISLPDALHSIRPRMVPRMLLEHEEFDTAPRAYSEISQVVSELVDKVWYNRHQNSRWRILEGAERIIEQEDFTIKDANSTVVRDIWEGALNSARRMEALYGPENLGPWDDFEWGMINGKLSALRWVLGDDWDCLDM